VPRPLPLTLFDLDHTLLDGDTDILWCDFLLQRGAIDRAQFEGRNKVLEREYQAGTVSPHVFSEFYVSTLAGHTRATWEPVRREFLDSVIAPRIGRAAHELVARHRSAGEMVVLTTATNRFLAELTAAHLGMPHLIATECEIGVGGHFTGRIAGLLNMRDGKVTRLHEWLTLQRMDLRDCESTFYSDSINDLPLLSAVRHPVAVNPDLRLAAVAAERGWPVLQLRDLAS
jgi:HAD superfamily hydrolase (TIGR01490 family)